MRLTSCRLRRRAERVGVPAEGLAGRREQADRRQGERDQGHHDEAPRLREERAPGAGSGSSDGKAGSGEGHRRSGLVRSPGGESGVLPTVGRRGGADRPAMVPVAPGTGTTASSAPRRTGLQTFRTLLDRTGRHLIDRDARRALRDCRGGRRPRPVVAGARSQSAQGGLQRDAGVRSGVATLHDQGRRDREAARRGPRPARGPAAGHDDRSRRDDERPLRRADELPLPDQVEDPRRPGQDDARPDHGLGADEDAARNAA